MYDWLLPAEVFNERQCPEDDIWPCAEAAGRVPAFFPSPKLQFSAAAMKPVALTPDKAKVLQPLAALPPLPTATSYRRPIIGGGGGGGGGSQGRALAATEEPRPQTQPTQPGDGAAAVTPVVAKRAESCVAACERWRPGGRCTLEGLRILNTCEAMQIHLGCATADAASCEQSAGPDQPARVAVEAPRESRPDKCLVNGAELNCAGSHHLTTRLCACEVK